MLSTVLAYPQGKCSPLQIINLTFGCGGEGAVAQWYGVGEGVQRSPFPFPLVPEVPDSQFWSSEGSAQSSAPASLALSCLGSAQLVSTSPSVLQLSKCPCSPCCSLLPCGFISFNTKISLMWS